MKKTFQMIDLDCANAAVSFMTQKLTIEAEDDKFDDVVKQAVKACKKVEPDCEVVVK